MLTCMHVSLIYTYICVYIYIYIYNIYIHILLILLVAFRIRRWIFKIREQFRYKLLPYDLVNLAIKICLLCNDVMHAVTLIYIYLMSRYVCLTECMVRECTLWDLRCVWHICQTHLCIFIDTARIHIKETCLYIKEKYM